MADDGPKDRGEAKRRPAARPHLSEAGRIEAEARAERLAAALRANLKRRKAQTRARGSGSRRTPGGSPDSGRDGG
jgi:hypothetical protein